MGQMGKRPWPPEVRRDALQAVREGNAPVAVVARRFGVPLGTLRAWIRADRATASSARPHAASNEVATASETVNDQRVDAHWDALSPRAALCREVLALMAIILGGVAIVWLTQAGHLTG